MQRSGGAKYFIEVCVWALIMSAQPFEWRELQSCLIFYSQISACYFGSRAKSYWAHRFRGSSWCLIFQKYRSYTAILKAQSLAELALHRFARHQHEISLQPARAIILSTPCKKSFLKLSGFTDVTHFRMMSTSNNSYDELIYQNRMRNILPEQWIIGRVIFASWAYAAEEFTAN